MELYKRIRQRRQELNMSQEELARLLGYKSRSTINKIENGTNDIPQTKIQKFADALQTTPEFLMNLGKNQNNAFPAVTPKDERSIQKRVQAILDDLAPNNSAVAYFDGNEPMSDADRDILRISLENTVRLAKQMAKQKFTPNKYRK